MASRLLGIDDPGVEWRGARVLVRSDLNVPLEDGRITDDARIRASVPTLERLLAAGAGVAVCSHLGRPKGRRDPDLSLRPCADRLGELMGRTVELLPDCVGPEVRERVARLGPGELVMLENLRFHEGEEANDPGFAESLAQGFTQLRERRLRGRPPRPRLHRGRRPPAAVARPGCCSRARSRCWRA